MKTRITRVLSFAVLFLLSVSLLSSCAESEIVPTALHGAAYETAFRS